MGLLIVIVLLVVVLIVAQFCDNSKASSGSRSTYHSSISFPSLMSSDERQFANEAARIANRGLDAKSLKTAEKAVSDYEIAYDLARMNTNLKNKHIYEEDLRDLREVRDDLRKERWYNQADKILDKFYDLYSMITDPDFRDVEKAYKSKNRCIKYWQEYFQSMPDDETRYRPKQYLREQPWYDPCMESHELLEKRLSACIEEMKPEYKRKVVLKQKMTEEVAKNETILRADLMRACRDGYTDLELKYCYKELLEKYVLSEVKYSNRYIVSLSEKEKERRQNKPRSGNGWSGARV